MKSIIRCLSCLLALHIIFSTSFAESKYSTMRSDELINIDNDVMQELIDRQIAEQGYILISDEYDVKIYFYGFLDNTVQYIIINKSDKQIGVLVKKIYIENWDVSSNSHTSGEVVDAGKNSIGYITIDWSKCLTSNIEEASKMDIQFKVYDIDNSEPRETEIKTIFVR